MTGYDFEYTCTYVLVVKCEYMKNLCNVELKMMTKKTTSILLIITKCMMTKVIYNYTYVCINRRGCECAFIHVHMQLVGILDPVLPVN